MRRTLFVFAILAVAVACNAVPTLVTDFIGWPTPSPTIAACPSLSPSSPKPPRLPQIPIGRLASATSEVGPRISMPFILASIELPERFAVMVHDEDFSGELPELADTPLRDLADEFPHRRPMLEVAVSYVAAGSWELFAVDSIPSEIGVGKPMVQVFRWNNYCGQPIDELGEILLDDREANYNVEQLSIQNVELRHGTAKRTRYVQPDGFLTPGPWVWVEYTIVAGAEAFGIGGQAPLDQQAEAVPLFEEIAESFLFEP